MVEGDGLPDKICHPCKFQLEKSYAFRKKCETSDLKLRQHLLEIQEYNKDMENEAAQEEEESREALEITGEQEHIMETNEQNTEAEIVQSTIVKYIEADNEPEADPENITLPSEVDKEACTLKNSELKTEVIESEDGENIFIVENSDPNMDVIADAVKATLANQPGMNNILFTFRIWSFII